MYVYIYICVYVHTYIYTHIRTYMFCCSWRPGNNLVKSGQVRLQHHGKSRTSLCGFGARRAAFQAFETDRLHTVTVNTLWQSIPAMLTSYLVDSCMLLHCMRTHHCDPLLTPPVQSSTCRLDNSNQINLQTHQLKCVHVHVYVLYMCMCVYIYMSTHTHNM